MKTKRNYVSVPLKVPTVCTRLYILRLGLTMLANQVRQNILIADKALYTGTRLHRSENIHPALHYVVQTRECSDRFSRCRDRT